MASGALRCISLWQPWATLWVSGAKTHETRHWPTNHRGPLIVHAAKRRGVEEREFANSLICRPSLPCDYDELPFGAIVGAVDLVACVRTETVYDPRHDWGDDPDTPLDYWFGNFAPGRWAWRAECPMELTVPIAFKGAQGFFDVPALSEIQSVEGQRGLFG